MVLEMGTGVFGLDVRRIFGSTANTIGMRWDTGGVWADGEKMRFKSDIKMNTNQTFHSQMTGEMEDLSSVLEPVL